MMKLCCKSQFTESASCLLNEVILEMYPAFERFCYEVVEIGSKESGFDAHSDVYKVREIEDLFASLRTELFEFITKDSRLILKKMKFYQMEEAESEASQGDVVSLVNRFKAEMSLCPGEDIFVNSSIPFDAKVFANEMEMYQSDLSNRLF